MQHYPPQEPYPPQAYATPYAQPAPQQYNIVSPQYAQPPPPVHPPVDDPKRFPKSPKFRDVAFAILFILHIGAGMRNYLYITFLVFKTYVISSWCGYGFRLSEG